MGQRLLEVPSDITLLEERYSKGPRVLSLLERLGLVGMPPMWHIRRIRNDKHDYYHVLSRQYNSVPSDTIEEILITRQRSIHKRVVAHNMLWVGAFSFGLASLHTMRYYDYKSKLIVVPCALYGGSWIGRWIGDMLMGRLNEFGRDRFLGNLPSSSYFSAIEPESKTE
ncbi:putative integral membrane protein, DUF56 family protein [Cardiosporidium cionae]|uniref:Integral membrane protein, DUF56 family protein n=1 Tax=Cardiosporidium cionae TaxID=476202 RepID=A0ABQ7J5T8_9APIC|nr:putative integral membrane protein, DUF56 family protein [Cardiosporidium cionae]|eukprot:KAF8819357.1 putative integral membrane protein, DUF56 family protein [Cardiosporidium cionae]